MDQITVRETPRVLNVVGFPGAEISGVRIYNSKFAQVKGPDVVKEASDVKLIECSVERLRKAGARLELFDGNSLAGWTMLNGGNFVASNNCIHLGGGMGWLRTDRRFTNFVFEAEWRGLETNYNSGFFLRVGDGGQPWPDEGWQVNLAQNGLGGLKKGSKLVLPFASTNQPIKKWVKFRMEANGQNLTLDIDGQRAWEFKEMDVEHGFLGLQAENKMMDFRHLRVRELN
jgi:hypothetical protein